MPIEWTAITDARRVDAATFGTVSGDDWVNFIEGMRIAGVRGYAKLLDLSHASVDVRASEIRKIAQIINAFRDDGGEPLGAAAFVIDSATALDVTMLFEERSAASNRPSAVFASRELATEWLASITSAACKR